MFQSNRYHHNDNHSNNTMFPNHPNNGRKMLVHSIRRNNTTNHHHNKHSKIKILSICFIIFNSTLFYCFISFLLGIFLTIQYVVLHTNHSNNSTIVVNDNNSFNKMRQLIMKDSIVTDNNNEDNTNPITDNNIQYGILLTSQCSGSDWVRSILNQIDGITIHNEILAKYTRSKLQNHNRTRKRTLEDYTWKQYYQKIHTTIVQPMKKKQPNKNNKNQLVAFKLMYDQIPPSLYNEFISWVNQERIVVIHLRRKCTLMQLASQIEKIQRRRTVATNAKDHIYDTQLANMAKEQPIQKVSIHVPYILRRMKALEEIQEEFHNFIKIYAPYAPYMDVSYEDLYGPNGSYYFNAILGFLGFSPTIPISLTTPLQNSANNSKSSSIPIKIGDTSCHDRIDGFLKTTMNEVVVDSTQNNQYNYDEIRDTQSQIHCLMIHHTEVLAGSNNDIIQSTTASRTRTVLNTSILNDHQFYPSKNAPEEYSPGWDQSKILNSLRAYYNRNGNNKQQQLKSNNFEKQGEDGQEEDISEEEDEENEEEAVG